MVGTYGNLVFTVSDRKIYTFRELSQTTAARFANHDIIGQKPKTEYLGPGLDGITFSITISTSLGIRDVYSEIQRWQKKAKNGTVDRLVIGKKRIGNRWYLESCSQAWGLVNNRGALLSTDLSITLKEYS